MTRGNAARARSELEELDELRQKVEQLVGGSAAAWWPAVIALRCQPLSLEALSKALGQLRAAPPLAVEHGSARELAPSLVAVRFVESALRRGITTEAEIAASVSGLVSGAEVRAALLELQASGGAARHTPRRAPPVPPRQARRSCERCDGRGRVADEPGAEPRPCPACNGKGQHRKGGGPRPVSELAVTLARRGAR